MVIIMMSVVYLIGCGNAELAHSRDKSNIQYSYNIDKFAENYPGYYVTYDDNTFTVTNYDLDKEDYPITQEMIQYGNCGIHNDGIIYFIYIMNSDSYCYLEIDPTTLEILYEDDSMFNGSSERMVQVNKLISILNTVIM